MPFGTWHAFAHAGIVDFLESIPCELDPELGLHMDTLNCVNAPRRTETRR